MVLSLLYFIIVSSIQAQYHNAWTDYTGAGITVGVGESSHPAFEHEDLDHIGFHVISEGVPDNHATSVCAIIAADNPFDGRYDGLAKEVDIVWDFQRNIYENVGTYWKMHRMCVTNNSYVNGLANSSYAHQAQTIDSLSLLYDSVLHVVASGNNATAYYSGIQSGKNVLTVGNMNHDRKRYGTSPRVAGIGGRLYIDIMAVGIDISSAGATRQYIRRSGSSQAAPFVTAAAAILCEAMGGPQPNALLRNLLCNNAYDIHARGPDYKSGYGSLNLRSAINNSGNVIEGVIGPGERHEYTVALDLNRSRIMLSWNDAPSAPGALGQILINDLDLEVNGVLPCVARPLPNDDDRTYLTMRDSLHTLEQVRVNADSAFIVVSAHDVRDSTRYFVTWN